MIEDILSSIRNIFVGREPELQRLKGLWELACQEKEHLVRGWMISLYELTSEVLLQGNT